MLRKDSVDAIRSIKDWNGRVNDKYELSNQFANREFVQEAFFDIAVSGNIPTSPARDLGIAVPSGALISDIVLDIQTALTSSGHSATLDILLASADVVESDGILVNDYAEASLTAGCKKPTLVPKKVSTETNLKLQAGTEKFDAGKLRVIVKYFMARE